MMGPSADGNGWVNINNICQGDCDQRMPLPESHGKHCPKCGTRVPTWADMQTGPKAPAVGEAEPREVEWMAAVLEWCRINRPDILPKVEELIVNDAFTLLMGASFDAGRCFQYANADCPLGPIMPGGDWNTITDAVYESRGERLCDCSHTRDQHDEVGRCDECDCGGFAP